MQLWKEVRAQLGLALPVILIQIGMITLGLVDMAFVGRVSEADLAAVSLGNNWSFTATIFGMGLLSALDPVVSQAFGARDEVAIARALQRGLLLALIVSLPIVLVVWPAEFFLGALGQPPETVPIAGAWARVSILGIPAFLIFVALRQTLQAMHILRPLLLTILGVNLLNVFLDWVLIFGNLGSPALGAVGSSWGTAISRWVMVGGVVLLAWGQLAPFLRRLRRKAFALRPLLQLVSIGWPVGLQFTIEVGAFALIAFLMGHQGSASVAGHQVAMGLASFSFMVPLAISMAASVRVGNEIGRGDPAGARRSARVALVGGAGVMLVFALLFLLFPRPLARLFTDQEGVLAVAIPLLPLAAGFQIFDGIQVVATGILRGTADTRVPMLIHVGGFWLVGMPLAWFLARSHGPRGPWLGLLVGLAVVASVQLLRVRVRFARSLDRIELDEPAGADD